MALLRTLRRLHGLRRLAATVAVACTALLLGLDLVRFARAAGLVDGANPLVGWDDLLGGGALVLALLAVGDVLLPALRRRLRQGWRTWTGSTGRRAAGVLLVLVFLAGWAFVAYSWDRVIDEVPGGDGGEVFADCGPLDHFVVDLAAGFTASRAFPGVGHTVTSGCRQQGAAWEGQLVGVRLGWLDAPGSPTRLVIDADVVYTPEEHGPPHEEVDPVATARLVPALIAQIDRKVEPKLGSRPRLCVLQEMAAGLHSEVPSAWWATCRPTVLARVLPSALLSWPDFEFTTPSDDDDAVVVPVVFDPPTECRVRHSLKEFSAHPSASGQGP